MTTAGEVRVELTGLILRVREAVEASDRPDAGVIAHELCAQLSPEEVREALWRGVRLLVERESRSQRAAALRQAREDAAQSRSDDERERRRQSMRARLDDAARSHEEEVAERFFAVWKQTPTGRKFLGECTATDLRYAAECHRERAGQSLHHAACDEALARALAASGAETVRELGYEAAAAALGSS